MCAESARQAGRYGEAAIRTVACLCIIALAGCASIFGDNAGPLAEGGARRVTYDCESGHDLVVIYDADTARIVDPDGSEILVPQRPSGSGFWFESPTHSLRGQGTELAYTIGRRPPVLCRQNNVESM